MLLSFAPQLSFATDKTWNGGSLFSSNWSSGGTLGIGGNWSGAAAPAAGDNLIFAGGTRLTNTNDLAADTSFVGITFNSGAGAFTLSGNKITLGGNVTNNSTNLQTINLAMILSADRTFTTSASGGNLTIGGVLSETGGARGIIKAGTGTLTLSGANTYTGATTVSEGILKAGVASVANTSGAFGNNSAVTLANTSGVTLDITGFNTQIGSLTGGGATGGNVTLGAATLTTGGDNTSPAAYAGVISGTGGLTKIGTGTQTLSGANTYTGATTVSGGTLLVNGSTASGSAVTVNSTGTLGGTGTVNGTVSVASGGTIDAGPKGTAGTSAAVGTLNTGALTLASGSTFHGDAFGTTNATQWDHLVVNGLATLGSATFTMSIASGLSFTAGTVYTLIDATTISGIFAGMAENTNHTFDGYTFTVHYNAGGDGNFELTAVPEPSTWVAGALACAVLAYSQRRQLRGLIARGA